MSQQIRVLIADDHALLREGLRKVLSLEDDIEVIGEAIDGVDVIVKCQELQPDIVLMDVNMPRGGGVQATRRLRELMPNVSVIVLTIHDDEQSVAQLINAGAKGYILKDVEPERLAQAIRRVRYGETFIPNNLMAKLIDHIQEAAATAETRESYGERAVLTERELEVLQLIVNGMTNKEIADHLIISEKTVKNHVTNILKKLCLQDRTQAAVYAIRHNLVTLE